MRLQQQPDVAGTSHSSPSQLVSHLLASTLLGGASSLAMVNPLAGSGSSAGDESQGMHLLSILQDHFVLSQLLPQLQAAQNHCDVNPIMNPAIALYYQQVLQQQQQQNVLQQLMQQPLSQSQTVLLQHTQIQTAQGITARIEAAACRAYRMGIVRTPIN
ncbi:unnamed protein product [Haemonchus placei]|uniref:Uncharacterized protein n=1 Tax=Haemonchus placei TaxID=6290 RepID=A0A3P7SZM8_HAEPC|nr:unnamed protein product [Haemonchus placei]